MFVHRDQLDSPKGKNEDGLRAVSGQEAATWARFDLFFGAFVVANGLLVGYQTDLNEDSAITNAKSMNFHHKNMS